MTMAEREKTVVDWVNNLERKIMTDKEIEETLDTENGVFLSGWEYAELKAKAAALDKLERDKLVVEYIHWPNCDPKFRVAQIRFHDPNYESFGDTLLEAINNLPEDK